MAIDRGNEATTQLLTLLNVSATKTSKRKWVDHHVDPHEKLNKRRNTQEDGGSPNIPTVATGNDGIEEVGGLGTNSDEDEDAMSEDENENTDALDSYERHFGPNQILLSETRVEAADKAIWSSSKRRIRKLGSVIEYAVDNALVGGDNFSRTNVPEKWRTPFEERQQKMSKATAALQNDLVDTLSSYKDLYVTHLPLDAQHYRQAIMLHAINHVVKKRRHVLKNNERLSRATKAGGPTPEDIHDQGFTRPSVLVLLPFRSFALRWLSALISHTPPPVFQVENNARFQSEYGLPPNAVDKFTAAEPGMYPRDHIEMLNGNTDDSFRVGIKMTRKSVKLFAEFYGCDIIFASPLGLRMSIQKEKSGDFLSSIEMLIVDQMDALTMQNWDHMQFILSNLNQLPKESHNADFSRIKPWYLDGHAAYLRQSILLTAYETPETRSLFHRSLKNVAGKLRTERHWSPVPVPDGIQQTFVRFVCGGPQDEADKRFHYFSTQLMPMLLRSAVQSANTVIFVPSSFDFIRVHNYFRKTPGLEFTILSEYSSNQDISRARQAFFSGKKAFLLVSERFHFFRRYKIRGIRNLVFYGPPDHAQFYTEYLSYPFMDDGVESSDVTCRVLYSKYDWMRLERIAGTDGALKLVKDGIA